MTDLDASVRYLRRHLASAGALGAAAWLAACGSAPPPPYPTPPPQVASCAWYTATARPGQVVNVSATGPVCKDRSLIDWLTSDSDRPWTTTALIPGAMGTLLGQLGKGSSVVRVWFTGPSTGQAGPLAGRIATALAKSGWTPQEPTQ